MNGIKKEYGYLVLNYGEIIVVRDEEKVAMLVKNFKVSRFIIRER